jgi:hypothetical protein
VIWGTNDERLFKPTATHSVVGDKVFERVLDTVVYAKRPVISAN